MLPGRPDRTPPPRPASAAGLWTTEDLVAVVLANAVGVLLMAWAWLVTSGSGAVDAKLAWLNMSALGLSVAGVGNGWWLARGRRRVVAARVAVFSGVVPTERPAGGSRGSVPLPARDATYVAVPGTSRYHGPGCPMVAGKAATAATRRRHEQAGRRPCEVCRPEVTAP